MDIMELFSGTGIIALAMLAAGIAFVIVEMFNPGFGLPGVLGIILIVAGIVVFSKSIFQALLLVIIILIILGLALALVLKSAAKGNLYKHFVLKEALKEDPSSPASDLAHLLGKDGVALTTLRPSGAADFNGLKLDVVTDGDFLEKSTKIKIVKIEGNRIIVQKSNI